MELPPRASIIETRLQSPQFWSHDYDMWYFAEKAIGVAREHSQVWQMLQAVVLPVVANSCRFFMNKLNFTEVCSLKFAQMNCERVRHLCRPQVKVLVLQHPEQTSTGYRVKYLQWATFKILKCINIRGLLVYQYVKTGKSDDKSDWASAIQLIEL